MVARSREPHSAGHEPAWTSAASIGGMLLLFFLLDLAFPTGVASGVPYILPVLISLRLPGQKWLLVVAALATGLTILGFFLPSLPGPDSFWLGVENRAIALMAIWVTAWLGYLFVVRKDALHEQEVRLQTVVDTTPDLILAIDASGKIETANAAAGRAFGRTSAELHGLRLADLLEAPSRSDLADVSVEISDGSLLIEEGRTGTGFATIPGGDLPRTVRWTVKELDETGRRLAVGHDLTDLLAAKNLAVRSERLAAIGQTLATLSHESKNELLAIRFGLEQLSRCWDDQDAAADLISALLGSQDRVWRLFEDVKGYAAPIRLKPTRVSPQEIWRQAWRRLAAREGRDVRLIEPADGTPLRCVVDPFRLEQVFRNLFENALAACSDPVQIEISCSEEHWRGEPALVVKVRDDGPGLPDDVRDRLFEPFFTTKPQGTGIGLSLCRRILEAHHGDLAVGPSGGGAEFVLTLPCAGAAAAVEATPASREPVPAGQAD